MATIGDKKVSLALQDGSSINLNKPKILPADVTSFTQITEPGFYRGGMIFNMSDVKTSDELGVSSSFFSDDNLLLSSEGTESYTHTKYNDSEINYVITDGPANLLENDHIRAWSGSFKNDKNVSASSLKIAFDLLVVPMKTEAYDDSGNVADIFRAKGGINSNNTKTTDMFDGLTYYLFMVNTLWIGHYYINGYSEIDTSTAWPYIFEGYTSKELKWESVPSLSDVNDLLQRPKPMPSYAKKISDIYESGYYAINEGNYTSELGSNEAPSSRMTGVGTGRLFAFSTAWSGCLPYIVNDNSNNWFLVDFIWIGGISGCGRNSVQVLTAHVEWNYDTTNKEWTHDSITRWYPLLTSDEDIVDSLTSTSTTEALSANQGKVLKGLIDDLQDTVDDIPQVSVEDSLESDSDVDALSANQGKVLKELIDNIPQVTVTDSLTSTSTTEALSAAQGKALNEAKAPRPIFSTTDIEIGSDLECGQLYFVMN